MTDQDASDDTPDIDDLIEQLETVVESWRGEANDLESATLDSANKTTKMKRRERITKNRKHANEVEHALDSFRCEVNAKEVRRLLRVDGGYDYIKRVEPTDEGDGSVVVYVESRERGPFLQHLQPVREAGYEIYALNMKQGKIWVKPRDDA